MAVDAVEVLVVEVFTPAGTVSIEVKAPVVVVAGGIASISVAFVGTALTSGISTSLTLAGLLDPSIPPSVGNPAASRCALHALYFSTGNLSFTSSIVMSFFSLRRRCGLGIA